MHCVFFVFKAVGTNLHFYDTALHVLIQLVRRSDQWQVVCAWVNCLLDVSLALLAPQSTIAPLAALRILHTLHDGQPPAQVSSEPIGSSRTTKSTTTATATVPAAPGQVSEQSLLGLKAFVSFGSPPDQSVMSKYQVLAREQPQMTIKSVVTQIANPLENVMSMICGCASTVFTGLSRELKRSLKRALDNELQKLIDKLSSTSEDMLSVTSLIHTPQVNLDSALEPLQNLVTVVAGTKSLLWTLKHDVLLPIMDKMTDAQSTIDQFVSDLNHCQTAIDLVLETSPACIVQQACANIQLQVDAALDRLAEKVQQGVRQWIKIQMSSLSKSANLSLENLAAAEHSFSLLHQDMLVHYAAVEECCSSVTSMTSCVVPKHSQEVICQHAADGLFILQALMTTFRECAKGLRKVRRSVQQHGEEESANLKKVMDVLESKLNSSDTSSLSHILDKVFDRVVKETELLLQVDRKDVFVNAVANVASAVVGDNSEEVTEVFKGIASVLRKSKSVMSLLQSQLTHYQKKLAASQQMVRNICHRHIPFLEGCCAESDASIFKFFWLSSPSRVICLLQAQCRRTKMMTMTSPVVSLIGPMLAIL